MTSPILADFGKFASIKKGLKVDKIKGLGKIPNPLLGLSENPDTIHDVTVSGIWVFNVIVPLLKGEYNVLENY
jgi:hypothetical protein